MIDRIDIIRELDRRIKDKLDIKLNKLRGLSDEELEKLFEKLKPAEEQEEVKE